jgi:Ca2+:H+ antiporter
VFAAVMITCNGIVGLSLLVTALRRRVAVFNTEGTGAALPGQSSLDLIAQLATSGQLALLGIESQTKAR